MYSISVSQGPAAATGPISDLLDEVARERAALGLGGGSGSIYVDLCSGALGDGAAMRRPDAETLVLDCVSFAGIYGSPPSGDLMRAYRAARRYRGAGDALVDEGLAPRDVARLATLGDGELELELDLLGLDGERRGRVRAVARGMREAAGEMGSYLEEHLPAAAKGRHAHSAVFHELEHLAFEGANRRAAEYFELLEDCGHEPWRLDEEGRARLAQLAQDVLPASEAVARLASEVYLDGGSERLGDEGYRRELAKRVERRLALHVPAWASRLASLGYARDEANDAAKGMVLRGCEALERALAVAAEGGLSGLEAWYSDVI